VLDASHRRTCAPDHRLFGLRTSIAFEIPRLSRQILNPLPGPGVFIVYKFLICWIEDRENRACSQR